MPTPAPSIASAELTSLACPTVLEGTLSDGRLFQLRYRYGLVTLNLVKPGDSSATATASHQYGDNMSGVLSYDDAAYWTLRLVAEADSDPDSHAVPDAAPLPSKGHRLLLLALDPAVDPAVLREVADTYTSTELGHLSIAFEDVRQVVLRARDRKLAAAWARR